MVETQCCPVMDLQWTPRLVEDQYADVYFCASCGHVHRTEKYATNLRFPYNDRCVNCGGDLDDERCTFCGLTPEEDKALHDRLASLHPDRDYMLASRALFESGRYVLALKLATAQVRWGADPVAGEVQRLSVLEAMNEFDRALDEAYEWADNPGCPPVVFGVIAGLEANLGNLQGALVALERGLAKEPGRSDWWIDYAELNVHLDERANALRAAAKALPDPTVQERAISVMAEVGERYYASGQYAAALSACSLAQDLQERYVDLAWLRARIAANHQDSDYMIRWLETTVALDPGHDEAQAMLAPYKRSRSGWFGW
ncbi:MAG: hypothetical protein AAF211_24835 [Myxococcota bacterium]